MKRRRTLGALLALLGAPLTGAAQTSRGMLRIATLDAAPEDTQGHHWRAFFKRLAELGYIEGRNLAVERRFARGATERLPALAAEVVALKPGIIVANGTPAARAAKQASATIPIVFLGVADPVRDGIAASLARPGGNLTGLSIITGELGLKLIELLREIAPGARRFAFLGDTSNVGGTRSFAQLKEQVRALGITILIFDAHQRDELGRSLDAVARDRYEGFYVGNSAPILANRDRILQFAAQQKLPAVYPRREYVDAGGLLSYGVDLGVMYPRAAEYVHRIAQGAKPAELPIERPDVVRMVVSLKTARAQGIVIPKSILVRADEVIE